MEIVPIYIMLHYKRARCQQIWEFAWWQPNKLTVTFITLQTKSRPWITYSSIAKAATTVKCSL